MNKLFKLAGMMALIVSISSHAASFDCGKARKLVEVAICADAQLSDADEKLAAAYRAALAANQNEWKAEIVKDQRRWLVSISDEFEKQKLKPNQWQTPRDWLLFAIAAQTDRLQEAAERERIIQLEQSEVAKEVCLLVLNKENMSLKRDEENNVDQFSIQFSRGFEETIWSQHSDNVYEATLDFLNSGSASIAYQIWLEFPSPGFMFYVWVAPGEETKLAERLRKGVNFDDAQSLLKELTREMRPGVAPRTPPVANSAMGSLETKLSSRLVDVDATMFRDGVSRLKVGVYMGITYIVSESKSNLRGPTFAIFRPQVPGSLVPMCYFRATPSIKVRGNVLVPSGYDLRW
jgi:uncharacterized protein YecT (DUF1311 family)